MGFCYFRKTIVFRVASLGDDLKLLIAVDPLADGRHKFSPKRFTQHQLLACLVLKEFLRLDNHRLAGHLADNPDLARAIELRVITPSPPSRRPRSNC